MVRPENVIGPDIEAEQNKHADLREQLFVGHDSILAVW
jgi:hypothetical protein